MPADWLLVLFDITAIVVVAWLGGIAAQRLGQPRIAGEMAAIFLAGVLLGGRIADIVPGQQAEGRIAALFPETAVTLVTVVGGLGLVLYMLLVGITIDPRRCVSEPARSWASRSRRPARCSRWRSSSGRCSRTPVGGSRPALRRARSCSRSPQLWAPTAYR